MILRGVKIVPPLLVTEGHKFNLDKCSTPTVALHGRGPKCRILFYYLKWVAKIYYNTLID